MTAAPDRTSQLPALRVVATAAPAAAAIAVFGALFGASARGIIGAPLTLLASALIFSGALQFALLALVTGGASAPALLITGATLNLRHIVLGAVLRPHLDASRLRRGLLAWFLLDESFGFAIASGKHAERTLFVSGLVCYLAWQVGTLIGVLGAGASGMEDLATAIFPVLFIGLAALAATDRSVVVRSAIAALLTAAIAVALPGLRGVAPVVAALLVALPGGKTRDRLDDRVVSRRTTDRAEGGGPGRRGPA